jgi:hypothetical protein
MPADVKPSTYFGPGYTVDATAHVIKFNTASAASNKLLAQLLDAAADPTTGNVEQVLLAICEAAYQAYRTQQLANNKPLQSSVQRAGNPDFASGGFFMQYTFSFNFTDAGVWSIVAET